MDEDGAVSQISAEVPFTEVGTFWNSEDFQQHKNTQELVHTSEVCVHHRVCIFMRGLDPDLCLLQPLTREYPTCRWLTSDVSELTEPTARRSDRQFVFPSQLFSSGTHLLCCSAGRPGQRRKKSSSCARVRHAEVM